MPELALVPKGQRQHKLNDRRNKESVEHSTTVEPDATQMPRAKGDPESAR